MPAPSNKHKQQLPSKKQMVNVGHPPAIEQAEYDEVDEDQDFGQTLEAHQQQRHTPVRRAGNSERIPSDYEDPVSGGGNYILLEDAYTDKQSVFTFPPTGQPGTNIAGVLAPPIQNSLKPRNSNSLSPVAGTTHEYEMPLDAVPDSSINDPDNISRTAYEIPHDATTSM